MDSHNVRIQDAVKVYGDFKAVAGITLDIRKGEFFTLLGPSGCGKTTLLRMIAGFNTIDSGSIFFGDRAINSIPAHKRGIGMVFQNYAIFPHLSVADNVAYGLKARKVPGAEIGPRVKTALEMVQIGELANRMPNELSGGQQQRVALARAFVIEPSVLLMDEPLSNLDAKLRVQMRTTIKKLQRKLGITTIYVTHDQEEAYAVGDRIVIMLAGDIVQIGAPQAVYRQPADRSIARFLGFSNILPAQRHPQQPDLLHTAIGDISSEQIAGAESLDRLLLLIRPESARIDSSQPADARQPYLRDHRQASHACLGLTGYLSGRSFRGSQYRIALRVPAPQDDLILTFDLPAYQSSGDPGALHPVELPADGELLRLTIYPNLITVMEDEAEPDHATQRSAG